MGDAFWRLDRVTDAELLASLTTLSRSSRRLTAEVIAHLGEVEDRRLHLDAGFGSMFAYCLSRLRLSEDEAYRRIKVARLARRYPAVYPRIAAGQLTLSVVCLLEPHLSEANEAELLELVSGHTVTRARELLAARFPRPDVAASIRKLPEARIVVVDGSSDVVASASLLAQLSGDGGRQQSTTASPMDCAAPVAVPPVAAERPSAPARLVEPLSAARFKIQFTAGEELKRKIELARDLMRHAQPDGDLAAILERALDVLLEAIMRRRFGARAKRRERSDGSNGNAESGTSGAPIEPAPNGDAAARSNVPETGDVPASGDARSAAPTRTISRATRRAVTERDGLRCTWRGPDGTQCEARAWLENDHAEPWAVGGRSDPSNVRSMCRAHNRRAAELCYGREYIARKVALARAERDRRATGSLFVSTELEGEES